MNSNQTQLDKEKILSRIAEGKEQMRPRWHFVIKASLIGAGSILIACSLVFVGSFLVFSMRQNGLLFAPGLGLRGIGIFLYSAPWLLLFSIVIFLVLLELIVRRYPISYRRSTLYSLSVLIGLLVLISIVVLMMGVHERLSRFAESRHVPLAEPFYRNERMRHAKDMHPGVIVATSSKTITITNGRGEELEVLFSDDTRLPLQTLELGQQILVIGNRDNESVIATGIKLFKSGDKPFMVPPPRILVPN